VVLPLDVVDAGSLDVEERHRPAMDVPDQDLTQTAAAHEAESTEEQVVCLEHARLPWTGRAGLG
jgi:hypothetical protein